VGCFDQNDPSEVSKYARGGRQEKGAIKKWRIDTSSRLVAKNALIRGCKGKSGGLTEESDSENVNRSGSLEQNQLTRRKFKGNTGVKTKRLGWGGVRGFLGRPETSEKGGEFNRGRRGKRSIPCPELLVTTDGSKECVVKVPRSHPQSRVLQREKNPVQMGLERGTTGFNSMKKNIGRGTEEACWPNW